jgi:hypothetical protein
MSLCDALGGDKSRVTTIAMVIILDTISFPGLSCENEGRDEKSLVWAGQVTTRKMVVFDSYSSRSGEIFFN